jgi:hypothetical protein
MQLHALRYRDKQECHICTTETACEKAGSEASTDNHIYEIFFEDQLKDKQTPASKTGFLFRRSGYDDYRPLRMLWRSVLPIREVTMTRGPRALEGEVRG